MNIVVLKVHIFQELHFIFFFFKEGGGAKYVGG